MPNFAASLQDGSGNIAITASNGTMTINDYSNYFTSTEEGHLKADFEDYKRIIVDDPDGSEYTYSTLTGGDETILTPDNYSSAPIQTTYQYTLDGRYDVTLEAVPTWENIAASAWTLQTNAILVQIHSIYMHSTTHGWLCGDNGAVYTTANGGSTWTAQTSGVGTTLYSIHFADTSNGWCCGGVEIQGTSNGGSTWANQYAGGTDLQSVYFPTSSIGYSCGFSGEIVKTTNGGSAWNPLVSGTGVNLYSVFFINATTGWVCGGGGTIRKTTDGGSNWTAQVSGLTGILQSIMFIDANNGWVCGWTGQIAKTTNGGTTWTTLTSGTTNALYEIYFTDSLNGWVADGLTGVRRTSDGGTTWALEGSTGVTLSLSFADSANGWATTGSGEVYKYGINYNNYDEDDCVYHSGSLYQTNVDTYNTTPGVDSNWVLIAATGLPEKYRVTESIIITDNSEDCWAKAVYQDCCTELSIGCNDESICEDEKFLNLIKMDLSLAMADVHVDNLQYDKANTLINYIKDICDSCTD